MTVLFSILCWIGGGGACGAGEEPPDAAGKLREAELLEVLDGDIDRALALYREVAAVDAAPAEVRGRAWLRIAGAERKRGNLQAAAAALEKVLAVAPESAPERAAASEILGGIRGGAGDLHDWHEALLSNESIRSDVLRLVTALLSPDAKVSADAGRRLAAWGTIALPALRGAIRTARGPARLALARTVAEAGDWNYIRELIDAEDQAPLDGFLGAAAGWDAERRSRLARFVEERLGDVAAERKAALLEAAQGARAGKKPEGPKAEPPPAGEDPAAALARILPRTILRATDGGRLLTRIGAERVREVEDLLVRALAPDRPRTKERWPALELGLECLLAEARAGDGAIGAFEKALREAWKGEPPPARTMDIFPSDAPPPAAIGDLWKRALADAPPAWRPATLRLAGPDLPWIPDLLTLLSPWLADPPFRSGNIEADLAVRKEVLSALAGCATDRLESGRAPSEEEARRLEAFPPALLRLVFEDIAGALREPIEEAEAEGPEETEDLGKGAPRGPAATSPYADHRIRDWYDRRSSFLPAFSRAVPALLDIVAKRDEGLEFADGLLSSDLASRDTTASVALKLQRDVLEGVLAPGFPSREKAVRLAARWHSGQTESLTLYETAGTWMNLPDGPRKDRVREIPEDPDRRALRRKVAAFLRAAIEDGSLPPEARGEAFASLPLASLGAFRAIAGLRSPRVVDALSLEARGNWYPPAIRVGNSSYPYWLRPLSPAERVEALRALAATAEPGKLAAAIVFAALAFERGDAEVPEPERIGWISKLLSVTVAERAASSERKRGGPPDPDRARVDRCLATLWRRDLPETVEVLRRAATAGFRIDDVAYRILLPEVLSEPDRSGVLKRMEQDRGLVRKWKEEADRSAGAGKEVGR